MNTFHNTREPRYSSVSSLLARVMNRRFVASLAAMIGSAIAVQAAKADNLSILITPSGTNYYEWSVTVGSNTYSSGWIAQAPTQNSWDSQAVEPGGAGGDATVGNTQYFSLQSGLDFTAGGETVSVLQTNNSYWRENATLSTEAALIVTGSGTGSSSPVQNLLVLDGAGGIYLFKAPFLTVPAM